jgi:lipopolysaccharide transport system permease protein
VIRSRAVQNRNPFVLAARDIAQGVAGTQIWQMLGWFEIRQRYRRSLLGPFWLTLSTGLLVAAMGPLYGRLFGLDISQYFPYLAIGFVLWLFLAGVINDACAAFISAEGYIKQLKLPLTVHVMRMLWRNVIVFLHNAVIVALVLVFWPPQPTWHLLTIPLAVLLIIVNGIWIGISVGLVCARFRDIPQIIASLVQVAFFLTPVMWPAGMLGRNQWAALWNPFYHFLELVRAPLVTGTTNWLAWQAALGITVVGWTASYLLFVRYRARIAYWV